MAYGAIAAPKLTETLPTFSYPLPNGDELVTFHIAGQASEEVMNYLCGVFMTELQDGRTYPQESMTDEGFRGYFFNSSTIVAVVMSREQVEKGKKPESIEEAIDGRSLEEAIGGCYYVKPNYPGRSSHLCNAGFLVPPAQRGKKIGNALARSFLEYGPRLGYRGSVFNLVYKNNAASLRLWDTLGFQRVGLIPGAGRLRTADGKGEEYVDAVVVYKSFF